MSFNVCVEKANSFDYLESNEKQRLDGICLQKRHKAYKIF